MHHQTAFADVTKGVVLPTAESLASTVFSLPMHPYLAKSDCKKITQFMRT